MKKTIALLLTAALLLGCIPAIAENLDHLARIQSAGKIVFATEGNWAPWTYVDNLGELTGFDVEVARAVAEKLGVTAEFPTPEWSAILMGINSGVYDTAANQVEITEDRRDAFDFTATYSYNRIVVITRSDNDTIHSLEDLKGKTTANSPASTYMLLAESYGATVKGIESLADTMQNVVLGISDATLNAELSFYEYMEAYPDAPLKIAAVYPEQTEVAFPLAKGADNDTLNAAISQAIEDLRAEGVLTAISMKYFGVDITTSATAEE